MADIQKGAGPGPGKRPSTGPGERSSKRPSKATMLLITWAVAAALIILFVVTNSQSIELSLAFWDVAMPLWLVVVVPFLLGVLVGWLSRWWTARK
jgi:uncharacterized integral membrane protein